MASNEPKYTWDDGTPIENYDVIRTNKGALVVINNFVSYEYEECMTEEGILCVPARIVNDER